MNTRSAAGLRRRLLPLYAAIFCQGFVFWYATEKLFMTTIGFNAITIGVMVALYSAVIVLAQTPSGILADRWSRKGVLIIAGLSLALSGFISGESHSIPLFLFGSCFWGFFFALYSGTYDSVIYDTMLEETGETKGFEKYLGAMNFIDGIALILGSLLGGFIAQHYGLRQTYLYTIPIAIASCFALAMFREPQLHKLEVASPIKQQITDTLSATLRRKKLIPVLAVLVTVAVVTYIVLEFTQLWLIALSVPVIFYGPANAVILAGYSIGGALGGRLPLHKKSAMSVLMAAILAAVIGLIYSRNSVLIVACLTLAIITMTVMTITFTTLLHDSLPSKVRAGSSSAVGSLGRIIIIPTVLLFGYISHHTSIFAATWVLFSLLVITALFAFRTFSKRD